MGIIPRSITGVPACILTPGRSTKIKATTSTCYSKPCSHRSTALAAPEASEEARP
jgi:hypothetical protein